MLKNFTRPENEEPYYYATTVEDGEIVRHDGEPEHAVYKSEMEEISRRANLWHAWVEKNFENAYDGWGCINGQIAYHNRDVREQFMNGEREE